MTQKNQKVLIFSLTYLPFIGGAEVALKELTDRLPDYEFHMITAKISQDLPSEETLGRIHLWRVGSGKKLDKHLYPLRAYFLAKKLQKKEPYRLVWAMLETWGGIAALFFKLRFPQVKYLLTMQSGDSDWFICLRTWFWYPLYKMVFTRADHIQVISRWLAKRARSYGYCGEISVIPNGVDLDKFKTQKAPTPSPSPVTTGEGKGERADKIIFTDSRLVTKNGVADLIKSVHLLVISQRETSLGEASYPARLIILGSGPLEKELKQLASQLGIQDKVIFLGPVPYAQIQNYYTLADVFVRPSLSEGFGNVFVQAMAARVPVIATPVGGIVDFLKDGETGWFCQPRNPKSIAEKISYILDEKNKETIDRVVDRAEQMVIEKYSWDNIAGQMKNIFNSLI